MKLKRMIAWGLAACLLAGGLPPFFPAYAAEPASASLSFGGASSAEVVAGGSASINIEKPSYYVDDNTKNGLNITSTATNHDKSKVQVLPSSTETLKTIKIGDDFFNDPASSQVATLDIEGAYYALVTSGNVVETGVSYSAPGVSTSQAPLASSFELLNNAELRAFQSSSITLRCTQSETQLRAPTFVIDGTPTGDAFSSFVKVYTSSAAGRDPTKPITIALADSSDKRYEFSIETRTLYETDDQGNPLSPANRYVQAGTTFQLSVPQPTSNKVFLTVYSPKKAAENLASMVVTQAQPGYSGEQQFIQLADGEDIGFIRQDFSLGYSASLYNETFYLNWKWVPEDASVPGASEVVQFPDAASGMQRVRLNQLYDDVGGKLVAEIRCRDRNGEVLAEAEINVTIKGTGTPASLSAYSQKMPNVDEQIFVGDETKMPGTIYLNAYDGHLAGPPVPTIPYQYTISLNMGLGSAASSHAVVSCISGDEGIVTLQTITRDGAGEVVNNYSFGQEVANPDSKATTEQSVKLVINPVKTGSREPQTVTVQVTYYVLNAQGKPVEATTQPRSFVISVVDTSPDDDATLEKLVLKGKVPGSSMFGGDTWIEIDSTMGYSFDPSQPQYNLQLQNKYTHVTLSPTRASDYANKTIWVRATCNNALVDGWEGQTVPGDDNPPGYTLGGYAKVESGRATPEIPLVVNEVVSVEVVVVAEDMTTKSYRVDILRQPQGADATLKSLAFSDEDGNTLFDGLVPNQFDYEFSIPFKVQMLKVAYELNDPNAPALDPGKSFSPALVTNGVFSRQEWLDIVSNASPGSNYREVTLRIFTVAEDGTTSTTYNFRITREEPSEVNTLSSLQVLDARNNDQPLEYTPAFHAEMEPEDYYELSIPFAKDRIKVAAKAADEGATVLLLYGSEEVELAAGTPSQSFTPTPYTVAADGTVDSYYQAVVEVWPESTPPGSVARGSTQYLEKVMCYPLHIYRDPPSTQALLESIGLADQEEQPITFPDFVPEVMDYAISVPYEVSKVRVTPVAVDENVSRIEVNGRKVANASPSALIDLAELSTTITIVVTPEDTSAAAATYTLTITRQEPSDDARLVKLEVEDATDFSPVFAPSRQSYTARVALGAEGVRITATANHPAAKIEIDGVRVQSGVQSELVRILSETQTVSIVVTAQDGVTTRTYRIRFTNENLIEKTSNADLERLEVTPGVMRPVSFKPAVTEYEVTVGEEVYDVELFPVPADDLATIQVYQESREIGDYNGNYAGFLEDGENEFTVEVTSPDESVTKTYTVLVYRNEEDKMGVLNPVTAEDIDFEGSSNIIIVDISRYARVSADVFEELKNYPEKTIIFQGNDYSLQFNAKDLQEVIPHTEVYDFKMSFTSPLEEEIYDEIYARSENYDTDVVFVHFGYHGDLPGPATLALSLGQRYKNELLFWNYYNEERQRVDYYGSVRTNTRGNLTVTITHLSTYLVTDQKLQGAENKVAGLGIEQVLSPGGTLPTLNPDTGGRAAP